jgi:hypothetical protein
MLLAPLAIAAVLGAALHAATHIAQDRAHSRNDCVACQAAHGAGLPSVAPEPSVAPAPVERAPIAVWTPSVRPAFHVGHPRGPPV